MKRKLALDKLTKVKRKKKESVNQKKEYMQHELERGKPKVR
jgi:hypothetical protein